MSARNARVIYAAHPSSDFFTPAPLRVLAHEILGSIDFDPATSARNPLGARAFYTRGALERDWTEHRPRTIFMNPPYGLGIRAWLFKLIATVTVLRARALVLVPARPGARWYGAATDPLRPDAAQLLCELRGRVVFEDPHGNPLRDKDGRKSGARWGSTLLYWGPDRAAVARALRAHGVVRLGPAYPFKPAPIIDRRQLRIVGS